MRRLAVLLPSLLLIVACTSPEATRVRAGGKGSDVRNVGPVVEMHGGSEPYWETPRLVDAAAPTAAASPGAAPAEQDAGARRR
jgi:hypothetical protein